MTQVETTGALSGHLQTLWSIESQLVEAMPRMMAKATDLGLQKNLALHFEETRQQKVALEAMCKQLGMDASGGEPDHGLQQLLQAGEQKILANSGSNLDGVLIESALQVEAYEMAAYTPAIDAAKSAGKEGVAQRLSLTFEEERQSRTKLLFLYQSLFSKRSEIGEPALVTGGDV